LQPNNQMVISQD